MIDVRFYHLTRARVEEALPMIIGKANDAGMRMTIFSGGDQNRLSYLSDLMWNYVPNSFYANGFKGEKDDADYKEVNPIWISDDVSDIEGRPLLLQLDGAEIAANDIEKTGADTLNRICHFFDGRDEQAVQKARTYWKSFKDANNDKEDIFDLSYWQQDDNGRWSQKA